MHGLFSSGIEQKFALFLTTDPKVPINTTSAIITQAIYDTNICLKFWYLIPNQNSELKVYVTVGNHRPTVVWETYHQLSSRWKQVAIPIHVNGTSVVSGVLLSFRRHRSKQGHIYTQQKEKKHMKYFIFAFRNVSELLTKYLLKSVERHLLHQKTINLHIGKQRRRSAVEKLRSWLVAVFAPKIV